MALTLSQQQAVEARNRELLVSAAAGSGKTTVLVKRIVQMIQQDGMSIDRMLIVTFTRAAAGEMRSRLERELTEAAAGDVRLQKQADLVSAAQISTIHAFCQQAVRQNFQHCQIDPQFGLCDERTRSALYDESMEEILTELYEDACADDELRQLTQKFTEQEIASMLSTLYRFLISRPDPMEWLERHARHVWSEETLDEEPMAEAFCREAGQIVDGMLSLWSACGQAARQPGFPEKYLSTLRLDGIELQSLSRACEAGLTHLISAVESLKFSRLPIFKAETSDEAAQAEAFKAARIAYKDLTAELQKLLPANVSQAVEDLSAMAPATRGLARTVRRFHERFAQKKREQAVIDFNDLEHMTLSILREPGLQKQLSERFDAIFVDEYQDVSELQEAILNALKREAGTEPKQYAFYVGDVKQSIYRFRLAEPGLFLSKLNHFSADEDAPQRKIILNNNFRSKNAVLNAVNRIFAHVMDKRVTEIEYDDDARLYAGVPSTGDPQTELHIMDSEQLSSQEEVMAEAEFIARDILQSVGQPVVDGRGEPCGTLRYSDIAILLPVGKNVAEKVELVLSRHGIPVYSEGGADPMVSDEITQVVQYLTVLDNLMNDVALLAVLRSPLFEMSEQELAGIRLARPEREATFLMAMMAAAEGEDALASRCRAALETLERERFYASSMPMGDYLWDFLGRSGLYAHYGAQPGGKLRQANLRLLCDHASGYEKNHMDGLHGFVESLLVEGTGGEQGPAVINPQEDVVHIMTIHKSKGLEFPTVYVMNLGRPLFGRPSSRVVSVHGEIGFGLCYVNEKARTRRQTLVQGAIALRERNAERAERARVLYVALTRPKGRLVMVGSGSYGEAEAVRSQPPADRHAVRSAHSMLDWIVQSTRPQDEWETREGFSTEAVRKTTEEMPFSTESTGFPQKNDSWRIVFHMGMDGKAVQSAAQVRALPDLPELDGPAVGLEAAIAPRAEGRDPIAPQLHFSHLPLKVGVTALCRAMETGDEVSDEEENADSKRFPLTAAQPRLLSSLPSLPLFLEPEKEERALQTGVETHRVLGLLRLDGARRATNLRAFVEGEVVRLTEAGVMTPAQASFVQTGMIARFLQSDLGRRMLASPRVMREWAFNLHVTEPFDTLVQGVVDLCFLENGAWVLVDFKTDRVTEAAELWPRYRRQMSFYRQALTEATPYPVSQVALYALRLGEACEEKQG